LKLNKETLMMLGPRALLLAVCLTNTAMIEMAAAQTAPRPATAGQQKKEPAPAPVPIEDGKVALTPKNTTVQFVGAHTGEDPRPRTGYFAKFTGELAIDEGTKAPQAASIEIETASLITPITRLTNHLRGQDFFDFRAFPKATFESTKVEAIDAAKGEYKITGELTIRDTTKPISFPATLAISDAGATLVSKFELKRSEHGITFSPEGIVEEVAMMVTIGKATPKVTPE
jgi:polyisoprenoid-binding protein YceI